MRRTYPTKVSYCCWRIREGVELCKNPPTRDFDTGYSWHGSFCDIHYRMTVEEMPQEVRAEIARRSVEA